MALDTSSIPLAVSESQDQPSYEEGWGLGLAGTRDPQPGETGLEGLLTVSAIKKTSSTSWDTRCCGHPFLYHPAWLARGSPSRPRPMPSGLCPQPSQVQRPAFSTVSRELSPRLEQLPSPQTRLHWPTDTRPSPWPGGDTECDFASHPQLGHRLTHPRWWVAPLECRSRGRRKSENRTRRKSEGGELTPLRAVL